MNSHDVVGVITVLAWPVTILVVIFSLRPELRALFRRVREIETPGDVKISLDPHKVGEIIEEARKENAPPAAIAERIAQAATVLDKREARILRALLDDDGRAIYNYQTDYYQPALQSLVKQGYVQRSGKGFALTPLGKETTKEYLVGVLSRINRAH